MMNEKRAVSMVVNTGDDLYYIDEYVRAGHGFWMTQKTYTKEEAEKELGEWMDYGIECKTDDGRTYCRLVYPFAFFKIKPVKDEKMFPVFVPIYTNDDRAIDYKIHAIDVGCFQG